MGVCGVEWGCRVVGEACVVSPGRCVSPVTVGGAPSYLYHVDDVAAARRDRAKGAAHGSEIPYLFGTLDYFASVAGAVGDEDRRFGEGISACWVGFAKTGVPGCSLVRDWPRYDAASDRLDRKSVV